MLIENSLLQRLERDAARIEFHRYTATKLFQRIGHIHTFFRVFAVCYPYYDWKNMYTNQQSFHTPTVSIRLQPSYRKEAYNTPKKECWTSIHERDYYRFENRLVRLIQVIEVLLHYKKKKKYWPMNQNSAKLLLFVEWFVISFFAWAVEFFSWIVLVVGEYFSTSKEIFELLVYQMRMCWVYVWSIWDVTASTGNGVSAFFSTVY